MHFRLWSLTLGNFAIGTGVLIMPGMLVSQLAAGMARRTLSAEPA